MGKGIGSRDEWKQIAKWINEAFAQWITYNLGKQLFVFAGLIFLMRVYPRQRATSSYWYHTFRMI